MSSDLTKDQRSFLERLDAFHGNVVTRGDLRRLADRQEDIVRQSCRREGYAEYVGFGNGAPKSGWRITAKGALKLRGWEAPR